MNTASSIEQKLQRLFEQLCDISTEQMDALDHENFDRLSALLNEKDILLRQLKDLSGRQGYAASIIAGEVHEQSPSGSAVRDLARRFQAHEKYVTRIVQQKLSLLGDRLKAVGRQRSAAKGYAAGKNSRSTINIAG